MAESNKERHKHYVIYYIHKYYLDLICSLQSSHELNYRHYAGSTQDRPCQQSVKEGVGLTGPYLLPMNYWLFMDSGKGRVTVFSCVPTAELNRLQGTTSNPRSHRWPCLVPVDHKTKSIDMNVKERFVGRRNRGDRNGRWEIGQYVLHIHGRKCLRAILINKNTSVSKVTSGWH